MVALAVSVERLVDVLHSIALRGRTGLLLVQRAGGEESEQGEIFLEQGEAVFARTSGRVGEAALSLMMAWEKVSTAFHESVVVSPELRWHYGIRPHTQDTGSLLPIELQNTQMLPVIKPSGIPEQEKALRTHSRELPVPPGRREIKRAFPVPTRQPASLYSQSPESVGANSVFRVRSLIAPKQVITGLDRRERLVFLLLDGKRSMSEIAVLIHRCEIDVARVLSRFLSLGLIECVV